MRRATQSPVPGVGGPGQADAAAAAPICIPRDNESQSVHHWGGGRAVYVHVCYASECYVHVCYVSVRACVLCK
jgi:hypothetical protein